MCDKPKLIILSMLLLSFFRLFKPPLATARAASCNGAVHLLVSLSICLSVAKRQQEAQLS